MRKLEKQAHLSNEDIEIQLFLETLYLKYGYDFKGYSRAHIKRRILKRMAHEKIESVYQMIGALLNDEKFIEKILVDFSINATAMFRDPTFFKRLKTEVFPILNTYPQIRIWNAGIASGEEVYSLAILLKEAGLYDKSIIYATDFNQNILNVAKEGIYSIDLIREYTYNYQASGGEASFSDYYTAKYSSAKFNNDLRKNIVFAQHNLVTDSSFSDIHLILCRNVLIYFEKDLKNKTLKLFYETLNKGCFLCLGMKETLSFTDYSDKFTNLAEDERIYQKGLF